MEDFSVMEILVYIFPSCLKGKNGKFSLEKVQMLKGISVNAGIKPIVFWIGKKEQQELSLLLSQVKLEVIKIPPSNKPGEENSLTVQRKYLAKCLKGVESYYVISELKSSNERFLTTKELTQDICDRLTESEQEGVKVFYRYKSRKNTVAKVLSKEPTIVIPKDNKVLKVPDIYLEDDE